MWVGAATVFLALPLITSKRRRILCMRAIRERRWISDDECVELGSDSQRRRQEEERRRNFRTTKSQEDDIRTQYLSFLMNNYTIVSSHAPSRQAIGWSGCGAITIMISILTSKRSSNIFLPPMQLPSPQSLTKSDIHNDEDNSEDDTGVTQIDSEKQVDDVRNESNTTADTIDSDAQVIDIEAPAPLRERSSGSEDSSEDLLEVEFDNRLRLSVPLPGHAISKEKDESESEEIETTVTTANRRLVSNGCAICLCHFEAGEEITWSSNPNCPHVFHKDCIINWYLTVGRKTQRRRKKENPDMTDEEALELICKFPILCPCCRQEFCIDTSESCKKCDGIDSETENSESIVINESN